jgi:hypothetical protein
VVVLLAGLGLLPPVGHAVAADGAGPVVLVQDGTPRAVVILARRATRPAQLAAREFVHYLHKITGAVLPIVSEDDPRVPQADHQVLIGESRLTREHGLAGREFAVQEYLIRTKGREKLASPARLKVAAEGRPWAPGNAGQGIRGRGLVLYGDAHRQYLQIDLAKTVNLSNDDFTIAVWFQPSRPGGVLLGSTTTAPYWQLSWTAKPRQPKTAPAGGEAGPDSPAAEMYPVLNFNSGCGQPTAVAHFQGKTVVADGSWHHYVLTVDRGRSARLYVDGELAGTQRIAEHRGPLKNMLTIGGPYHYLAGILDELTVFQGSCDSEEAGRLFQGKR